MTCACHSTRNYNGHPSRAAWNLSLWIGNDEGLYRLALECIRRTKNRRQAAERMVGDLRECGITATPDGTNYTVSGVIHAMRGF